jgi:hypothetical protein
VHLLSNKTHLAQTHHHHHHHIGYCVATFGGCGQHFGWGGRGREGEEREGGFLLLGSPC